MVEKVKVMFLSFFLIFGLFVIEVVCPQQVEATGGAFPYTKHGGGLDEGEGNEGVNRSYDSSDGVFDLGSNSVSAYSAYDSAECNHCHEIHASFGGSEPAPSDSGPHPFMTFKDAQTTKTGADFCLYCHDQFNFTATTESAVGDPPAGFGYHGVFQNGSDEVFKNSSHYTSDGFLWPEPGRSSTSGYTEPNSTTIHPRKTRTTAKGTCLNCHTPHGILGSSSTVYDSDAVPASIQAKPSTHPISGETLSGDITKAYLIPRKKIAWEEGLCENCHDSSGSADNSPNPPNIQDEIDKRTKYASGELSTQPSGTGSGHPVDYVGFAGQHSTKEAVEVSVKHVECYDCHNPHAVKAPTGTLGDGDGGRITGVKYVEIDGSVHIAGVGSADQPYVYELCFRCHGDTYETLYPSNSSRTMSGSDVASPANPLRTTYEYNGSTFLSAANPASEYTYGSNKKLEFNPDSTWSDLDSTYKSTYQPASYESPSTSNNTSYHPVASAGRNTTDALCLNLQSAFGLSCGDAATELANLTIQCTDCHNNEDTNVVRGPVTESNLRSTDKASGYTGTSPVGPHGSDNPRILRGNYNTTLGIYQDCNYLDWTSGAGNCWSPPFTSYDSNNFALCILCHDEEVFTQQCDKDEYDECDGTQFTDATGGPWVEGYKTNFYSTSSNINLHASHIEASLTNGSTKLYTTCANCHHNVHSNIEAANTIYDASSFNSKWARTTDGSTRLVNFSPTVGADEFAKPAFGCVQFVGTWYKGCNFSCHGSSGNTFIYPSPDIATACNY